ncbi:D-arabinono-1,4-lactone oxidase [Streptomyces sp. Q6]|uniref:D-arabinono-1,4-lactone oxidase n=1 Tax=Streptomyces citrinus TaxID=3118173 RepID=A0ACD5ALQ5_9ACTN
MHAGPLPAPGPAPGAAGSDLRGRTRATARAVASRVPLPPRAARWATVRTWPAPPSPRTAPAHLSLVFPQRLRFAALEYAVALEDLPRTVAALRAALRRAGFAGTLPMELRPGPAETTWLGPAHGRPTAWINLAVPRTAGRARWLRAAEDVLVQGGGRPHWAKLHGLDAPALRSRYPRWDDFLGVRASLDPDGLFLSPYARHLLTGELP